MKTYKFTINGNKYTVDINSIENDKAEVEVNRTPYTVELDMNDIPQARVQAQKVIKVAPAATPVAAPATASVPKAATAPTGGSSIKSPLPGVILDVFIHVGDTVKAGQRLMLLEAMKMENNIDADRDGVVKELRGRKGDSVLEGDILIVIE